MSFNFREEDRQRNPEAVWQAVEMFMGGQLNKPKYLRTTMDSGILCSEKTIDLDAEDTPTTKEDAQTKDPRISKAASVMESNIPLKMQSIGTETQRVGFI